jgi:hypothetical protein
MTEQENRQYAVNLLNRANVVLSTERIAVVSKIVELVEADLIAGLMAERDADPNFAISPVRLAALFIAIESGVHRPARMPVPGDIAVHRRPEAPRQQQAPEPESAPEGNPQP